ncbi:MAG: NAD(P)-dependent alcohol dehydrogenase [Acidobacteria bacterium]|nr:NAD(P)-dependent alcohol dehydrogenase [Acidobacteriota bacterium]MDW7984642.1 NAD(P)-dependent alcohol dehydrogenase [Acidobacteriota bacterium]
MRAARLHAYGHPLVVEEVPIPEVEDQQVLVAVEGAGFCHSDLHVIDGEIRVLPRLPVTLGHENAGRVARVGRGVKTVREGDPVAVYGGWGCGLCDRCVTGYEQLCRTPRWAGLSEYDGGYAEYLLVPHERYLIRLERLEPRVAAPFTDAALTSYRAIRKALPHLTPGEWALVIGVGGLGQFGIKLLRLLTASLIIAVDIDEAKLALARHYGATYTFSGREADLVQKILDLTGGRGVAASFDFVGSDQTLALALAVTDTMGKVTQLGLAGGTAAMRVLQNTRFEVQFEATLWGTIKELREVLALAEAGLLTPIDLEFYPLEAIHEVYARLKAGKIQGRAVIVPQPAG